jgi:thiol:disulfide interchange protein DsbA
VSMKVARAKQMGRNYKIDGVPTMIVNGKYVTSGSMTGSYPRTLEVVDGLIAMEQGRHHKR